LRFGVWGEGIRVEGEVRVEGSGVRVAGFRVRVLRSCGQDRGPCVSRTVGFAAGSSFVRSTDMVNT